MKPSERCRRDAQLIDAFRNACVELVNSGRAVADGYYSKVIVSATDNETWQRKRSAVAAAAGAAAMAYSRYGGTFTLRNAAYITNNVDPVTNWEMSLRDPEQLSPETIISSVDSAIARAGQEVHEAG